MQPPLFQALKDSQKIISSSAPNQPICPVAALKEYLEIRSPGSETFNDISGKTATRRFISEKLKLIVSRAGLDPANYNTHSLRIGRTTDLAKAGVPEAIIRETGRWDSDAFKRYIRFPAFVLPR